MIRKQDNAEETHPDAGGEIDEMNVGTWLKLNTPTKIIQTRITPSIPPCRCCEYLAQRNRRQAQMQRGRLVEWLVKTGKRVKHPTEQAGDMWAFEGKTQRKQQECGNRNDRARDEALDVGT